MTNWKEDEKLIDGFGLLYPEVRIFSHKYDTRWDLYIKATWASVFCVRILNQRIPQLENFLKKFRTISTHKTFRSWGYYKEHFGLCEEF